MAKYQFNTRSNATPAQTNAGTTAKTFANITAATATLCRGQIYEMNVGADGAPNATDCQIVYDVSRCTATGTGVTASLNPTFPGDVASRSVGKINHTIEPTYAGTTDFTVSIWSVILNQRASQRWIAAPGSELLWPATNVNGLGCRALSPTYAAPIGYNVFYDDL